MKRALLVTWVVLCHATLGAGQEPAPDSGVRLVSMQAVPEGPRFGEVFEVRLTLRVAPGTLALLPDTLPATEVTESADRGRWTSSPAEGDSLDVAAVYPLVGYKEGRVDLPFLELWSRRDRGPARVAAAAGAGPLSEDDRHLVPLGALTVPELAAMADSGALLVPQPPADVAGGQWSLWLLLAVGVLAVAGVGGAGRAAPRWWAAGFGKLRGESPRDEALKELERLRSLGLHRNGRIDEFYASTTGTLRTFASRLQPEWTTALTSIELLRKLRERDASARTESLEAAIVVAERVKFGTDRPSPEAAEADWSAIRDWIRAAPDP